MSRLAAGHERVVGTDFSNEAIALAELGYSVFALAPNSKTPRRGSSGLSEATCDSEPVETWWAETPSANIGLRTDGLLVVDVDVTGENQPNPWLTPERAADFASLGAPIAVTPSGGRHFVFRQPEGTELRNSQNLLAANVDTRAGSGGYIVVSPSRIPTGDYAWVPGHELDCVVHALPIAPAWLVDELLGRPADPSARAEDGNRREGQDGIISSGLSDLSVLSVSGVLDAIQASQPTGPGQRRDCLFHLIRKLKAIPEVAALPVNSLRPIVVRWHELARPVIRTKAFIASWGDFFALWEVVRHAEGENPVDAAWEIASVLPVPGWAQRYETDLEQRVCVFLRELQRLTNPAAFFLSCRDLQEKAGCGGNRQAGELLRGFVADSVLEVVEQHTTVRAKRYRFLMPMDD